MTNFAYGADRLAFEPVDGSIFVTPPASEKLIHHTAPFPYAMPIGLTPVVVRSVALFESGSIVNRRESRQARYMTPAPGTMLSQPLATSIRAVTSPVAGSIRSTVAGWTVQTDP